MYYDCTFFLKTLLFPSITNCLFSALSVALSISPISSVLSKLLVTPGLLLQNPRCKAMHSFSRKPVIRLLLCSVLSQASPSLLTLPSPALCQAQPQQLLLSQDKQDKYSSGKTSKSAPNCDQGTGCQHNLETGRRQSRSLGRGCAQRGSSHKKGDSS